MQPRRSVFPISTFLTISDAAHGNKSTSLMPFYDPSQHKQGGLSNHVCGHCSVDLCRKASDRCSRRSCLAHLATAILDCTQDESACTCRERGMMCRCATSRVELECVLLRCSGSETASTRQHTHWFETVTLTSNTICCTCGTSKHGRRNTARPLQRLSGE